MNAMFDYITGKKSGREAELEASLEHMGGYLGAEIEDNEKLRAEIASLRELVKDLADDLESEVEGHYIGVKDHPAMTPKFERDMANVRKARRVLEQPLRDL